MTKKSMPSKAAKRRTATAKIADRPPRIRHMLPEDIPGMLAVERESFKAPWTQAAFAWCIKKARGQTRQRKYVCVVVEHKGRVVGFTVCQLCKTRVYIENLAVAAKWRRCGIGSWLVAALISRLTRKRHNQLLAVVSERNDAAIGCFRANGFVASDIVPNWLGKGEDGYLMSYRYGWPKESE